MTEPHMYVVPHTHWDREWYEPHDVFRVRLVAMIDLLLDLLDAEPDFRFTLDGQAVIVDDYLEMRPQHADRLAAAVRQGRLAVGPFLILLDEFCCDGETIVRNLEFGIQVTRRLGPEMRVGYLPDMFGHAAQMPQILAGFGIHDAALWRGVPGRVDRHAFRWTAPDGSSVRTEYLWDGYGNALKLFDPVERAHALIAEYLERTSGWTDGEPVAGMLGSDHTVPRSDLASVLRDLASDSSLRLSMATVAELVAARDHGDAALARLPEVVGELRSHARGNLLPGVLSARTNLKASMARSERDLTIAERLAAVLGRDDVTAFLTAGWYRLVESTAHDSVTGCGVDDTAEEVGTRIHVASHLARGATDQLLRDLAARTPAGSVVAFNPSGRPQRLQVELVTESDPPAGAQLLEQLPTSIGDEEMPVAELDKVVRRIHGQELFGRLIRGYTWGDHALDFQVAGTADRAFDLSAFSAQLRQRQDVHADDPRPWRVRTMVPPSSRVLFEVPAPALGLVIVGPTGGGPGGSSDPSAEPVTADGPTIGNGRVSATVAADGTVEIVDVASGRRVAGALRLVDEGDRGDSYNVAPLGAGVVHRPERVEVEVLEAGPVRARLLVRRVLPLPEALQPGDRGARSGRTKEQVVDTVLEVRPDEAFLRVGVRLVNQARDHRLRLHVPTFERDVATSASAGQYAVTTRDRQAEGGWGEFPLPTYPATRFVHAGGVGVLVRKLTEYEVVDGDRGGPDEIALTLVRSVGMMSVNSHPLRDEPAGSELAVPGAQYLATEVGTELAIGLGWPNWRDSAIVRDADLFRLDPITAPGAGGPATSAGLAGKDLAGPVLECRGDVVLESLRVVADSDGRPTLEARLVNYQPDERPLAVAAVGTWDVTDLTGRVLAGAVDTMALPVDPAAILTLRRRA